MTKKRKILIIVTAVLAIAWVVRYITWNRYLQENYASEYVYYAMGETIPLGENYIYWGASADGYSLRIDSVRIVDYDQFAAEYDLTPEPEPPYEEILEITMNVTNHGSQAEGVPITDFSLHGTDWFLLPDYDLLNQLHGIGVYVEDGKTGTIHLPYGLNGDDNNLSAARRASLSGSSECYLALTCYPSVLEAQFNWPESDSEKTATSPGTISY